MRDAPANLSDAPANLKDAPGSLADQRRHLPRRAKWELALVIGGLIYIAATLALSLSSPVLSVLFVGMAGYSLATGRQR